MLTLVNACASVAREGPTSQERVWRAYLGSESRAFPVGEPVNADPQPVWRTDLSRGLIGGPVLAEDVVVVAQVDRQLALLERSTGEVIWRRRLPSNLGTGPLLADDRVFAVTQTSAGRVHALRLRTGRSVWSAPVGDVVAPLALADTVLYAAATDGWVTALRAATGARLWRVRLAGGVRAPPLPLVPGVVVATTSDSLFLLDAETGAIRVRRSTRGTVLAAPAVADSLFLFATSRGRLEACSPATLAPRWGLDLESGVVGHVAVQEGRAYALTELGVLWTVPLEAPERARRIELGIVARAGPAPVGRGVFVSSVNGEVALVDTSDGTRRWSVRLQAPVTEPVVVDGRLVLAVSARGEVVAFR